MYDQCKKPGSPGDILEHHGVKGMKWGDRKEEETSGSDLARQNEQAKGRMVPGTPEFKQRLATLTRTDRPQVLSPQQAKGGKIGPVAQKKEGLTANQKKALIGAGVGIAAIGGYVAYKHYVGKTMPGLDLNKIKQEEQILAGLKIPAHWDVSGLKNGPLSKQRLGDLAGGEFNAKLHDIDNLVVNTSRGYADILPKDGFKVKFAAEQHDSVIRALESMREKYPSVRNMNVEVIPMSAVHGVHDVPSAHMSVLAMRAGEARIMYNDLMDAPSARTIAANRRFLPGLGAKDYVAHHEMGHLLAAAHGEIPPAFDLLKDGSSPRLMRTWQQADPLRHKAMFAKHGFTFKELSKLSQYAATEPAEAMAELSGHFFTPSMRSRLTPDQIRRAEAMFNEMGGLS